MNGLRKKRRKGMGIAELAVVIAVISIVSLIVVSFTLMVSDKVRNSREKVNAMNDITVIESIVDTWITKNIEAGNEFYYFGEEIVNGSYWTTEFDLNTPIILASFSDNFEKPDKYVFEFAKGTKQVTCKISDDQTITHQMDTVESIHFNVGKKEGDIIFFCTITYKVATSNKNSVTHTYTFTINPRVGDYKVGA